jgi:hypothetical protein
VSLDRPALRWPGVLDGVREGAPLRIGARHEGNGWCLWLGPRSACPLGFTVGSGWRLVWFPQALPARAAPWLNGAWLALLFLPIGFWLRGGFPAALALALPAGALLAAPLVGLLPTPPTELGAAVLGLGVGIVLQPLLREIAPRGSIDLRTLPRF